MGLYGHRDTVLALVPKVGFAFYYTRRLFYVQIGTFVLVSHNLFCA